MQSLEQSLWKIMQHNLDARGLAHTRLWKDWNVIAGPLIGSYSTPYKLTPSAVDPEEIILHLACKSSAAASVMNYYVPDLLQRIRHYFGYALVHQIRFRHYPQWVQPLDKKTSSGMRRKAHYTEATLPLSIKEKLQTIKDEDMRKILISIACYLDESETTM
jgi:hypothetical protein